MKRIIALLLCLVSLLSLCACSGQGGTDMEGSQTSTVQTPSAEQKEKPTELILSEDYGDDKLLVRLYPQAMLCDVYYNSPNVYRGPYSMESEGLIAIEGEGVSLRLKAGEEALILEGGNVNGESAGLAAGTMLPLTYTQKARSGSYVTESRNGSEQMELELDLDAKRYSLDGFEGSIEFVEFGHIRFITDEGYFEMRPIEEAGWQGFRYESGKLTTEAATNTLKNTAYVYGVTPENSGSNPNINYVYDPNELEDVDERSYRWRTMVGETFFHTDLNLYKDSYEIISIRGSHSMGEEYQDDYFTGSYTEDADGRISIDTGEQLLVFSPETPDTVYGYLRTLESGSITAASSDFASELPPEDTQYMQVEAGAQFFLMQATDYAVQPTGGATSPEPFPDFIYVPYDENVEQSDETVQKTLVVSEHYSYYTKDSESGKTYDATIRLYPASSSFALSEGEFYYTGKYSESDGLVRLEAFGEEFCFSRGQRNQLIYESGSIKAAVQIVVPNEDGVSSRAEWLDEYRELNPGEEFNLVSKDILHDGIYVLDSSGYNFSFNEVLMDIDLSESRFRLRGYDGSVTEGDLLFEEDDLIAQTEDGRIILTPQSYGKPSLYIYGTNANQLLFYPDPNGQSYPNFVYDAQRQEELVPLEGAVSLNSLKIATDETYCIYSPRLSASEEPYGERYYFRISHDAGADTWEFGTYYDGDGRSLPVEAVEKEDGSIVFSLDGKNWSFHRENGRLIYDGGDALVLGDPNCLGFWYALDAPPYELKPGTALDCEYYTALYDTVYIIPSDTNDCGFETALRFDFETGQAVVNYRNELVLQGSFSYTDGLRADLATDTVYVLPAEEYTCGFTRALHIDTERGIVAIFVNDIPIIVGSAELMDSSWTRIDFNRTSFMSGWEVSFSNYGTGLHDFSRFMLHNGLTDYMLSGSYPELQHEKVFIPVPATEELLAALPFLS